MPKTDQEMTKPDEDVRLLDETIQDAVLAHQWERIDGVEVDALGVYLKCSCGATVMIVAAEKIDSVLRDPLDGKLARRCHQAHLIAKIGERLESLYDFEGKVGAGG